MFRGVRASVMLVKIAGQRPVAFLLYKCPRAAIAFVLDSSEIYQIPLIHVPSENMFGINFLIARNLCFADL